MDLDEFLGVRCLHVCLSDGEIIWREDWNHYEFKEGALVVGVLVGEDFKPALMLNRDQWCFLYETWSDGDHEFEADSKGRWDRG